MPGPPESGTTVEVVCPHCRKTFDAKQQADGAARLQGYKCPHCRLHVALDRIEDPPAAEAAG